MDRRNELIKILEGVDESKKIIVLPMVDDIVFLEEKLTYLRKLPFIKTHPTDLDKQKISPAAKQYKELLQQYNNCVKILIHAISKEDSEDDSLLRQYLKRFD